MTPIFTKALLIDDDKINNYLSKEIIISTNIATTAIVMTDGEQGLNYIRSNCLSKEDKMLILLDLNMPVMDGLEFLDHFTSLSLPCEYEIVILTSSNNERDKKKIEKYNIKHIIYKPITEEKLSRIFSSKSIT